MYVPNYIPQPLEIPGNVAQLGWTAKLAFLRRVTVWHLASVAALVALSAAPFPSLRAGVAAGWLAASLVAACAARIATRASAWDLRLSAALLPAILVASAWTARSLAATGFPIWAPLAGLGCAATYTFVCGRDFSFVGQYLLSLVGSVVGLAIVASAEGFSSATAARALGADAAYLTFYCYDLASLLSRRREGEECAATVDLYRDVLNVFGWIVRCLRHWRRHRIWNVPWA